MNACSVRSNELTTSVDVIMSARFISPDRPVVQSGSPLRVILLRSSLCLSLSATVFHTSTLEAQ